MAARVQVVRYGLMMHCVAHQMPRLSSSAALASSSPGTTPAKPGMRRFPTVSSGLKLATVFMRFWRYVPTAVLSFAAFASWAVEVW